MKKLNYESERKTLENKKNCCIRDPVKHIPIEDVISSFKGKNTSIYLSEYNVHTPANGYTMDMFKEKEQNRNHWWSREGSAIKYLILHYTVVDLVRTMKIFTSDKPTDRLSAHFVISQKEEGVPAGIPIQIVPDSEKAAHAGISFWSGEKNLNNSSMSIELVNQGFVDDVKTRKKTWFPFDKYQIFVAGVVASEIVKKYNIKSTHVLGHSDIAPTRKQDPGILFPWDKFYNEHNVGAWLDYDEQNDPHKIIEKYNPKIPCPTKANLSLFLQLLADYGYEMPKDVDIKKINQNSAKDVAKVEPVIKAFKSHFSANQQPECYNGNVGLDEMYWAWALTAKYGLMRGHY